VIRPVDVLLDFLEAEQARGVTHVHLDEEARNALRELFIRSKGGLPATTASPSVVKAAAEMPAQPPSEVIPSPQVILASGSPADQLDSLRRQAKSWSHPALGSMRDIMVFASGNPEARLMLVAEAPGYHEEREGAPCAGQAGEKLDGILKAMGLSREEIYISHIVKFRPSAQRQTTNARQSTPEEMAAFLPILASEVEVVRPDCIIALGETAAQGLLGLDASAASLRETWHTFRGIPLRVSAHPSRLLQTTAGNAMKRQIWEDMLAVMEKLEMPISERQRNFFQKP
jgi:uracil-DNA glycosylase family 4